MPKRRCGTASLADPAGNRVGNPPGEASKGAIAEAIGVHWRRSAPLAAVFIPLAVAYCVYWMLVWVGGSDPSQASLWEPLFLVAWGGSGILACMILVGLMR